MSGYYTINSGVSFLDFLASSLLEKNSNTPEKLTEYQIFLPTRRACRSFRDSFLKHTQSRPLLLPRMQPIGDIDEHELSLGQENIEILPALSPLKRQILLAKTIEKLPDFSQGMEQNMALAGMLGQLMDQVYTEDLDLKELPHLIDKELFAEHWQITVDFLEILSKYWPEVLSENNVIDAADRRIRLLKKLTSYWRDNPPKDFIIAAGSTGSIPATAELLHVIGNSPNGFVILPGLDHHIDDASWNSLEETHPQALLKSFLEKMGCDRKDVKIWYNQKDQNKTLIERQNLIREVMRPAQTVDQWHDLTTDINSDAIFYYECQTLQEEASVIAIAMREILETPDKTAALITPDRKLARLVAIACKRWGINLDDSAGTPLPRTPAGSFLLLSMQACRSQISAVQILSLLKHSLCTGLMKGKNYRTAVRLLEKEVLRGPKIRPGFDGIHRRIHGKNISKNCLILLEELEETLQPLLSLMDGQYHHFLDFLKVHIQVTESLSNEKLIWANDDGEAAAKFLLEIEDHGLLINSLTGEEYCQILTQFMKQVSIRPRYGTHPRLMILGQLEARLIQADRVILSGLNEGSWPSDPSIDPWMSQPMRKQFGLPTAERSIGLAAHDFVQGFCSENLILTRSQKIEGTPTVPSRWLQRLEAVLKASGSSIEKLKNGPHIDYAHQLDHCDQVDPYKRPNPKPPIESRPRKLSVTQIEQWIRDPYSIYARHILKLKPLDPLEKEPDYADKGTILHAVLDRFISTYPDNLPDDSINIFIRFTEEEIEKENYDSDIWSFWRPRLYRMAEWFIAHENSWRAQAKPLKTEAKGILIMEDIDFSLTARVDRVDLLSDSQAAIIDYKSGGIYAKKAVESGDLPQLPLEALILSEKGFGNIGPTEIGFLGYWKLTGGNNPGDVVAIEGQENIHTIIQNSKDSLSLLIKKFDAQDMPYYSIPNANKVPRFNDYEHLARVKEWTALGDEEAA